jgi:hypothetical protein
MTSKIRAAAALLAVATAACAMGRRPPDAAPTEKTMTSQEWKGQMGGPETRGHQVVSDERGWKRVWRELGQDAPELDLEKFSAVAVYVGQRPTGGYTAVFDEPVAQGDDLLVRYRIPKPAGFVTQAFTQPWKVRAFARPKGRVIVEYLSQ